jgi:hypothetical protein
VAYDGTYDGSLVCQTKPIAFSKHSRRLVLRACEAMFRLLVDQPNTHIWIYLYIPKSFVGAAKLASSHYALALIFVALARLEFLLR